MAWQSVINMDTHKLLAECPCASYLTTTNLIVLSIKWQYTIACVVAQSLRNYTHTHTHIKYTNRDLVRRRGSKNESNYGIYSKVLPGSTVVKKLLPIQETQKIRVWSLDQEETLEREMATHYSILAWRIPWTEEPGRLQNMGLQRAGHDSVTTHAHYWYICYTLIVLLLHTLHCLSFKYYISF